MWQRVNRLMPRVLAGFTAARFLGICRSKGSVVPSVFSSDYENISALKQVIDLSSSAVSERTQHCSASELQCGIAGVAYHGSRLK